MPLLRLALLLPICLSAARAEAPPPIEELVRRAFDADRLNDERAKNYTFRSRVEERKLDKDGGVLSTESKTYDVTFPYGQEHRRLVERDGRPLDEAERRKEDEKFEKAVAKRAGESGSARRKRLEKQRKEDEESRKFREEVVRAFDFSVEGDEERGGVRCWRVRAEPKPGYAPSFRQARFLAKMRGRMWIAQDDYGWRRLEVESTDTVSMGLFLFRLREGAEFELEQERVNDEVWMLENLRIRFDAKLGLVKGMRREVRVAWSDFRRFSADSQIVEIEGVESR